MTNRTQTWLDANQEQRDPAEWFTDLLDSLSNMAGTGRDTIYVSAKGDNTNGDGDLLTPYLTFAQAFTAVSASKTKIIVFPGTYTENPSWPTRNNIQVIGIGGQGAVTLTGQLSIYPATAMASKWNAYIDNITIAHTGTGLYVNNSSAAGTFAVYMKNVDFSRTGGTSIITAHGTDNPIVLKLDGGDVDGKVYGDISDANDQLWFRNARLTGGLVTSGSGALGGTAEITIITSEVLHQGVSGGSANQLLNSINSWSRTSETYAAVDTNDLAGDHTENIV